MQLRRNNGDKIRKGLLSNHGKLTLQDKSQVSLNFRAHFHPFCHFLLFVGLYNLNI